MIRAYQPSDRAAVRQLAFDTAELGARSTFPDFRLQVDLLTRYYTDQEPESLWILEQEGTVAGYLTGCLNTDQFNAWLCVRGNLLTAFHVLFRNFYRPAVWQWARARIRTLKEGGAHRNPWIKDYPAHLHINVAESARGAGAGERLIEKFVEQCRAAGVCGVHLGTRGDNTRAQEFFKRNQFVPIQTVHAYRPSETGLVPVPVLIMGRKL
jgi:ribosomal protein S18 acetylase RimI-like enzyme